MRWEFAGTPISLGATPTPPGSSLRSFVGVAPNEIRGKNENRRVASPESVPIHLKNVEDE